MAERTLYTNVCSTPSRAACMIAKQIGLDIEFKEMDLTINETREPWYLKINPDHTVPCIKDGDFVLWESRSLLRYLCNAYAPDSTLYPKDPKQRALVDKALDKDLGCYYPRFSGIVYPVIFGPERVADQLLEDVKDALNALESQTEIKNSKFICGDLITIADFATVCSVTFLEQVKYDFSAWPKINEWVKKCKALPQWEECNIGFEAWKVGNHQMVDKLPKERRE